MIKPISSVLVANQFDLEPTRSVLHRGAAVLAIECNELRDAERLIGWVLAGNPPADIADELRDLHVRGNLFSTSGDRALNSIQIHNPD